ncbi:MAG: M23 family metallopeptidase [Firmicutes bacterium]|nr:M23 family metallopeptidase [Bacillota bacterium]
MGAWERLSRTLGLVVLLATLTALTTALGPFADLRQGPFTQPSGSLEPETVPPSPAVQESPPPKTSPTTGSPTATGSTSTTGSPTGASPRPAEDGAAPSGAAADRPTVITHVVAEGETVSGIAARYGVSTATVAASSGLRDADRIYPGQLLTFPSVDGLVHRVRTGDTLGALAAAYGISARAIVEANGLADPDRLAVGQLLILPGARATRGSRAVVSSTGSSPAAVGGALAWPVRGPITSAFGPRWGRSHNGIDIGVAYGTTIRAAAAGKVVYVGWYGQYGRTVIIDHGRGLQTLYGHASQILVRTGQYVTPGEPVAYAGSTGNATGPHLHFEVRVNGVPVNPLRYLEGA